MLLQNSWPWSGDHYITVEKLNQVIHNMQYFPVSFELAILDILLSVITSVVDCIKSRFENVINWRVVLQAMKTYTEWFRD